MVKTLLTTCSLRGGNHRYMEHITQKTQELCTSEMRVTTLQITQCHNQQDTMNKIICLQTTNISIFGSAYSCVFRLQLNIPNKNHLHSCLGLRDYLNSYVTEPFIHFFNCQVLNVFK